MTCPHCQRDAQAGHHGTRVCDGTQPIKLPVPPPGFKRCSRCKSVKPAKAEYFGRVVGRLHSWCRPCCRAAAKEYARAKGDLVPCDPLKRLAIRYGCARKGSEGEAQAREELIAAVVGLARRSAA